MFREMSATYCPKKNEFVLAWNNIFVRSNRNKCNQLKISACSEKLTEPTDILNNVHGRLESGQLVALLGSSGSGKTTLLSAVSGRLPDNFRMEGQVTLNGRTSPSQLRKNLAYVDQFEIFPQRISLREHLVFNALLRLHRSVSYEDKMNIVEKSIQSFGLGTCAKSAICFLSGGERRRLAFATEALLCPPLFFCDEPTSGLDSHMCMEITKTMKRLSTSGCGILCSIHQPSSSVFALFDKVMLMAEGRGAFYGTTQDALQFFSRLGYNCPDDHNPADFFISLLERRDVRKLDKIKEICDRFDDHFAKRTEMTFLPKVDIVEARQHERSGYQSTWCMQTRVLIRRDFSELKYLTASSLLKPGLIVFVVILISSINRVKVPMEQRDISNILGQTAWFVSMASAYFPYKATEEFYSYLLLFYKERKKNMYRTSAVFVSHILYQSFNIALLTLFLTTPFYWTLGLDCSAIGYFSILNTMFSAIFITTQVGMLLAFILHNPKMCRVLFECISTIMMPFNLFNHSIRSFPVYVAWIGKITWFKYSMAAVSIVLWKNVHKSEIDCYHEEIGCLRDGTDVLSKLGVNEEMEYSSMGILLSTGVCIRMLLFLTMYLKSRATV